MNREITQRPLKFRAWNAEDSEMYIPEVIANIGGKWTPLRMCKDGNRAYKDDILVQFTGLLDKNGKEIFEGDIIDKKFKWIVVFEDGCFYVKNEYTKAYLLHEIIRKRRISGCPIEIVSNLFEHPNLLTPEIDNN